MVFQLLKINKKLHANIFCFLCGMGESVTNILFAATNKISRPHLVCFAYSQNKTEAFDSPRKQSSLLTRPQQKNKNTSQS